MWVHAAGEIPRILILTVAGQQPGSGAQTLGDAVAWRGRSVTSCGSLGLPIQCERLLGERCHGQSAAPSAAPGEQSSMRSTFCLSTSIQYILSEHYELDLNLLTARHWKRAWSCRRAGVGGRGRPPGQWLQWPASPCSPPRLTAAAKQAQAPAWHWHLGLLGICSREPPGGAASARPKVVAAHSAQRSATGTPASADQGSSNSMSVSTHSIMACD